MSGFMQKVEKGVLAAVFLLILAGNLWAEPYPFAQYMNIKSCGGGDISPAGDKVLFTSNMPGVGQLFVISSKGGWPNQITFYEDRVDYGSWSPDGQWILFGKAAGGSERAQLYLSNPTGEKVIQLTDNPKVIHDFGEWSPDGKKIAFASNERNEAYFDIYVMDLASREKKMVFQRDGNFSVAEWSPDGKTLIIEEAITNTNFNLYALDLATGKTTLLTPHQGDAIYTNVNFTPDSKTLYLSSDQDKDFENLAKIDLTTGKVGFLENEKREIAAMILSDNGRYMAYTANVDGYGELFVKDMQTGKMMNLPKMPKGVVGGISFTKTGDKLAFTFTSSSRNNNVWLFDQAAKTVEPLTFAPMGGIDRSTMTEPVLVKYKSHDGMEIPAFFYLPPGAKKDGSLPAVLEVHGGPESQERPWFDKIFQYFLSRGYAILAPNVRGSAGYGKAYMAMDNIQKRPEALKDLVWAVEYLKSSGYVDPKKIAVVGGSYGGYSTLAMLTMYPDLWAGGVSIVGIANFETFLKNTGAWRRKLRESEYGYLDKDLDFLKEISPVYKADKITAPLMVIQGANDPRVPQTEADQIVEKLKAKGGAVEYLLFPDEGHGLAKIPNQIKAYEAMANFLDKYVKNRSSAAAAGGGNGTDK
ncbi:MAG: S9 family peptidase [candidate division Zixibacteria bacterium]|nr:S9 family peptidase [candidate division Zixibacteria bacterium]